MEPIAIVAALAIIQAFTYAYLVGVERVKYRIDAPTTTGEAGFERAFRVHQNTVEQLVIFLPGLWIFGYYVNELAGAGLGLVFIVARFVYRKGYIEEPSRRATGFGIGALVTAVLVLGGLLGAGYSWYQDL